MARGQVASGKWRGTQRNAECGVRDAERRTVTVGHRLDVRGKQLHNPETNSIVKLPASATIAREKAERYLLVPQARGDKSAFLEKAGYSLATVEQLLSDLRAQLLPLDAVPLQSNKFGQYYEIRGTLTGPNGRKLAVRSIWMTEHLSGLTKFITVIPDKNE